MIKYNTGHLGLRFILRCTGSVFPRAILVALPNAILAAVLHKYFQQGDGDWHSVKGVDMLWAGYSSVLGFLIVFRNNQAYTRFWEGATLIHQVRGEWFNAVSSLFAFCNRAGEAQERVQVFQRTTVRLASMLYCSALQQVCELYDDRFEIIECETLDHESIAFMSNSNDRCEVILQWMQRLIIEGYEQKTLKVDSPLLTRAFQELSRGIVQLNNARKIKDIPFPFPYAQLIMCMLLIHWVTTPLIGSQLIESPVAAAVMCFSVTFVLWCLVYITMEIDQPFGEDPNDLPLREMQKDFNQSLLTLMHPLAQKVPSYGSESQAKRRDLSRRRSLTGSLGSFRTNTMEDLAAAVSTASPSLRHSPRHTPPLTPESQEGEPKSRLGRMMSRRPMPSSSDLPSTPEGEEGEPKSRLGRMLSRRWRSRSGVSVRSGESAGSAGTRSCLGTPTLQLTQLSLDDIGGHSVSAFLAARGAAPYDPGAVPAGPSADSCSSNTPPFDEMHMQDKPKAMTGGSLRKAFEPPRPLHGVDCQDYSSENSSHGGLVYCLV